MIPRYHLPFLTFYMPVLSIIIGLIIWLAVPIFLKGHLKKNNLKAAAMICKIIGVVIIGWAIVNYLLALIS